MIASPVTSDRALDARSTRVMKVTFAAATAEDYDAIADLWFRAQAARRPGSFVTQRDAKRYVAERAALPDAWFAIACEGERHVGIAYGAPARADDGRGKNVRGVMHVSTIAVEPSEWARGLGRAILEHVASVARERGFRRLELWTHADNVRAQRLCERGGFARTGREKRDVRGESIVQYARDLAKTSVA